MKWLPRGYGGERRSADAIKRDGWREQGLFAVSINDPRLNWTEREWIRQIAERLYGRRLKVKE